MKIDRSTRPPARIQAMQAYELNVLIKFMSATDERALLGAYVSLAAFLLEYQMAQVQLEPGLIDRTQLEVVNAVARVAAGAPIGEYPWVMPSGLQVTAPIGREAAPV